MKKLRVGVVGLGGIAQKAWLPVLGAATDWTLQGAWSPTREKAERIYETWRMPYAASLQDLARDCDAVFVHTSTATHYQVVSELLNAGVHVCVDKPLAENIQDAERLIELAARKKLTLMVGFNRRFAPLYQQLKARSGGLASLRMDKHRTDSVGPNDLRFTLLDDYLHVVDTALWLTNGQAQLKSGTLLTNDQGQMVYAEHHFALEHLQVTIACIAGPAVSGSLCRRSRMVPCMTLPTCANGAKRKAAAWSSYRRLAGKAPSSSVALTDAPATLSPVCKIRRFRKHPVSRPSWHNALLSGSGERP